MVSSATSFQWQPLCLPYLTVGLICLAAVISAGLIRGDRVVRVGLIGTTAAVTPWGLVTAAAICAVDPDTSTRLYQLANGPMTLIGPSLLLILLSISGQLDRYRWAARVAIGTGAMLTLITWTTPLVLDRVVRIPSGIWYPRAGALMWLHTVQIVSWPVMGLVIAWRAWPARHRPSMLRYLAALPAATMVGTSDTLLAYGIGGVYPFAWLPAIGGGLVCLHLMFRTELLRARGVERGAVIELLATSASAIAISLVVWAVTSRLTVEPVVVALLTAPLWGMALLITWVSPRGPRPAPSSLYERALEELARESSEGVPTGERLAALWGKHAGLTGVRLRTSLEELDAETRGWLCSLQAPVVRPEVPTLRLGSRREAGPRRQAVEALFAASGAQVIVPVIDRGELLAVVEAELPKARTLRDAERLFLFDSAQRLGHALTYDRLSRDAQAAVTSAREVELANVLAAHYRPLQDDERGPWRLAIEHRPSPHPGGVGWSWAPLPDGKVAAMIVEAAPQGVPGALVIAALQGAFAARSREPGCDAATLLRALEGTVATIERSALVIVLDAQARTMTWASAGHRGAAIVTEQETELLMDLGELGAYEPGHVDEGAAILPPGALVLLFSTAVSAAPGTRAALAGGYTRGLRLVTQLVAQAASENTPARDLLAIELAERA